MARTTDTLAQLGKSLIDRFSAPSRVPEAPKTPAVSSALPSMDAETKALFDVKASILLQVRADAALNGQQPTLEQYRLACIEFAGTEQGLGMIAQGKWSPAVYADLSHQDLSGFIIREPKLAAAHEAANFVEADYDGHDRDGDGKINLKASGPFYDNIRFDKADLHGAFVEPATSFNDEIAKAANHDGMTFSGMQKLDTYTFGAGVYNNPNLINVNGGEIVFADTTQVNGVNISGKTCKISIGNHASVNDVTLSDGFRVIDFNMGRNSVLSNSDLTNATIAPGSEFAQGACLQNVAFGRNVEGLNFSGLTLHNVSIDGKPITNRDQLKAFNIESDDRTTATASAEMVNQYMMQQKLAVVTNLGANILQANRSIQSPAPSSDNGPETLDAIRAVLQASQQSIGQQITDPAALAALAATEQAFKARQEEQSLGGPSRKA